MQSAVHFKKMKMTADLDGPIARISHQEDNQFAAGVRDNVAGIQKIFARLHKSLNRIVYCY